MAPQTIHTCLALVRNERRRKERQALKPRQRDKVAALLAAGRGDKAAWYLVQLAEAEDELCRMLANKTERVS